VHRQGFNRAVPQRPALIVVAAGVADVMLAVRFAAGHGLPVAVQATGHGMAVPADGALLIRTGELTGVRVDPAAGTAWIAAGVTWEQVIHEAQAFGLAPLNGSCPAVGAVSYVLGGGLGPLGRRYGFAADLVEDIDVVTADGEYRRVDAHRHGDLFWALRGGKGNFGAVTGMTVGLVPVTHLYGGGLYFGAGAAGHLLHEWREWTRAVPEAMSSSVALFRMPDVPAVPPRMRGMAVAHLRVAYAGPEAEGEELLRAMRTVPGLVLDTVAVMPYTSVGMIHHDPTEPRAFVDANTLLRELVPPTVDTLLDAVTGPVARGDLAVELRHLGGAFARPPEPPRLPGAVGHRDAGYLLSVVSDLAPERTAERAADLHREVLHRVAPWSTGGKALNFIDGPAGADDVRAAYDPAQYDRLRAVKAIYDPRNTFRVNHNLPPA